MDYNGLEYDLDGKLLLVCGCGCWAMNDVNIYSLEAVEMLVLEKNAENGAESFVELCMVNNQSLLKMAFIDFRRTA